MFFFLQLKPIKVPAQNHHREVDVREGEVFEAWISASTKVGQGQNSSVIQLVGNSVGK